MTAQGTHAWVAVEGARLPGQPWGVVAAYERTPGATVNAWNLSYVLPLGADITEASLVFGRQLAVDANTLDLAVSVVSGAAGPAGIAIFRRLAAPPTPGAPPYTRVFFARSRDLNTAFGTALAFAVDGSALYVGDALASLAGGQDTPGAVFVYQRSATSPGGWVLGRAMYATDSVDYGW